VSEPQDQNQNQEPETTPVQETTPETPSAESVKETEPAGGLGTEGGAMGEATIATPDAPVETAKEEPTTPQVVVAYKWGEEAKKNGFWWGTGRRKAAVARVRIRPGKGEFKINNREIDEYLSEPRDRTDVVAPLTATNTTGKLDVFVNVKGGGYMGQAQAILLGVARALKVYDCSLEETLRNNGYLTRDARSVERKKPGQPGARRRFQFSKR